MNDDAIDSHTARLESELDAARTRIAELEAEKKEARSVYETHVAQLSVGRVIQRKALERIIAGEEPVAGLASGLAGHARAIANEGITAASAAADAVPDEITRLRAEVERLAAFETHMRLRRLEMVDGRFEFELVGLEMLRYIADVYVGWLDSVEGAKNYLELPAEIDRKADMTLGLTGTTESVVITIQRRLGKTPTEFRQEAELALAKARVEIAALQDENATIVGERAISPTKTEHYERVELLHGLMKQPGPAHPEVPSFDVRLKRARLVAEEALELVEALGFRMCVGAPNDDVIMVARQARDIAYPKMAEWGFVRFEPTPIDLAHVAKEAADLSVVTVGTLVECGIKDRPCLEAVDRNNLDKLGPGHSFRDDGKLLKPPGHQPPDLDAVLRAQGWLG